MSLPWRLFALLMAVAWIPMVHSCELANVLGIDLEHHAELGGAADSSSPTHSGDCDHCAFCLTIDNGAVTSSFTKAWTPCFVALVPIETLRLELEDRIVESPLQPHPGADQDFPPQRWLFAERKALPPRAPSSRS